jgi:hypothetical protein
VSNFRIFYHTKMSHVPTCHLVLSARICPLWTFHGNTLYGYATLWSFLIDGHLHTFLAIRNTAAMHMYVQIFMWICFKFYSVSSSSLSLILQIWGQASFSSEKSSDLMYSTTFSYIVCGIL